MGKYYEKRKEDIVKERRKRERKDSGVGGKDRRERGERERMKREKARKEERK